MIKSERIGRVQPSSTFAMATRAKDMKRAGKDVVSLALGEPDFDTPQFIKDAAIAAMNAGQTKYTPVTGTAEVKQAIIHKFKRDNHLRFEENQVMVSTGAKQSLFNLCQVALNPGDEAILLAPYWVSYFDMVSYAAAKPVVVSTTLEQRFKVTPEQLEQAITDKTRLLFLNSPSNPTGMAYTREELEALVEVLRKHPNILIICDDIYEHIYWGDEPFVTMLEVAPDLSEQIVIVNGVSKAYAMTGWRLGCLAGPVDVIKAVANLQGQCTSGPNSIAQAAAAAAFNGELDEVHAMQRAFKERHDAFIPMINELDGFTCPTTDGAFYAFANVEEALKLAGIDNDLDYCNHLLDEHLLATIPGSTFGAPGHVRFSYATDMITLEKAIERLQGATRLAA